MKRILKLAIKKLLACVGCRAFVVRPLLRHLPALAPTSGSPSLFFRIWLHLPVLLLSSLGSGSLFRLPLFRLPFFRLPFFRLKSLSSSGSPSSGSSLYIHPAPLLSSSGSASSGSNLYLLPTPILSSSGSGSIFFRLPFSLLPAPLQKKKRQNPLPVPTHTTNNPCPLSFPPVCPSFKSPASQKSPTSTMSPLLVHATFVRSSEYSNL